MNIIRTKVIELSEIPAIAYKMKLSSGGSGIKIYRTDCDKTAFAGLDKRGGGLIPDARTDLASFPEAAFDEAMELLAGLPYSARGKVKVSVSNEEDADEVIAADVPEAAPEAADMVQSEEFSAIVDRFSNEAGKINYQLMNKQFIQFASGSKTVADMCGKKASVEEMVLFIIKNRAAFLAGKKENLSDAETKALIETIDEIDPRSAFKELNLHLRKMLAR